MHIIRNSFFLAAVAFFLVVTSTSVMAEPKKDAASKEFSKMDLDNSGSLEKKEYETLMYAALVKKLEDAGARPDPKSFNDKSAQLAALNQMMKQDIKLADAVKTSFAKMDIDKNEELSLQEYQQGSAKE